MPSPGRNNCTWLDASESGVPGGVCFDPATQTFYSPSYNATYHITENRWIYGQRSNALFGSLSTPDEAQDARMAVEKLNQYYPKTPIAVQKKYQVEFDTINKAWKDYDSSWVFYTFAQAVAIGRQAQELLTKLSRESPTVVPPDALNQNRVGGNTVADVFDPNTLKVGASIGLLLLGFSLLRR